MNSSSSPLHAIATHIIDALLQYGRLVVEISTREAGKHAKQWKHSASRGIAMKNETKKSVRALVRLAAAMNVVDQCRVGDLVRIGQSERRLQ